VFRDNISFIKSRRSCEARRGRPRHILERPVQERDAERKRVARSRVNLRLVNCYATFELETNPAAISTRNASRSTGLEATRTANGLTPEPCGQSGEELFAILKMLCAMNEGLQCPMAIQREFFD